MKKRIVLSLSIMIGMTIMLILCLQVVRAASPSQPECPSCDSFGIQRSQEKKEAPASSLCANSPIVLYWDASPNWVISLGLSET